jgi:DNA-binding XRE family transcriptional regulator
LARNKLRDRRKSLNLTQQELATLIGVGRTYYTEIENGNRNCGIVLWLKIGKALRIPNSELIDYIEEGIRKGA